MPPRFVSTLCVLAALSGLARAEDFITETKPYFEKHCIRCHGEDKRKGDVAFHELISIEDAFERHELIENALEQIRSGDMPPDDEDVLPTRAENQETIRSISKLLTRIKTGDVPQKAGRVTQRRLNRTEYHYTVRDLFGIKFDPTRDFPADGAGGEGFDNTGDALFSSPALLEKYLAAAHKIVDSVYKDYDLKRKVIFARPSSPDKAIATAEKVLTFHATLAYRRRVGEEDLAPLLGAFKKGQDAGLDYEQALKAPLTAMLMNPRFLFRTEHDQPGKEEWALKDFEIATRLSYFLWGSMPDRELFRIADAGKLKDPKVLREQTLRMLADEKSIALARHFGGQWMGYEKMINKVQPDRKRFPEFNIELRKAMYFECMKFMAHLFAENRPITDLINSDYTFANETLAKHYGLKEEVKGKEMQKVAITNKHRGGVLGMGGILASTSLPLRTSPVLRGVWVLESMLGAPPAPPPPDAGELPADDTMADGLTFREQLDIHRTAKQCASCHAGIDPIGYSLENFDAIGRWREKDANGKPIDSSAVLPGDIKFSSPAGLKDLLSAGKDKFARNMAKKMLAYSLGRGLEYYDEAIITGIVNTLKEDDYKSQTLVLAIVESRPFLHRSTTR